jgi:small conductance mechanosensitive channel
VVAFYQSIRSFSLWVLLFQPCCATFAGINAKCATSHNYSVKLLGDTLVGEQFQSLDQAKATAIDMAFRFGPKLFVAALILLAGFIAARWAGKVTGRLLRRFKLEPPVCALLERVVQVLMFGLFAILAMQNLGVELLPLIAGLGVAGAGVALALQGVLGNVAAGLTIIFTQPFHVGDYISIANEEGEVLNISLFSTTLGHIDHSRVVIPNRKIIGEILHNCGKIRRLALSVGIAYDSDVSIALKLIDDALRATPKVLQTPAPVVGVVRLSDANISIGICPWVAIMDYEAATSQINQAVLEAFRANRIAPSVPQRELRIL